MKNHKRIRNVRMRYGYRMIIELLVACFVVVFFYYSLKLSILAQDVTNVFAIPKRILYSCLPISGAVMILYSIRNITIEIVGVLKSGKEQGNPS
jgi:TRAP-type C4-dicarboxylate transport system permease small subunit